MAEIIRYLNKEIPVRRRRYQKNLGVSVYPSGEIKVSANKSISEKDILSFLESRKSWLESCLAEAQKIQDRFPKKQFRPGESYPYLGQDYLLKIEQADKLAIRFSGDQLIFTSPIPEAQWSPKLRHSYFEKLKLAYRGVAEKLMQKRLVFWARQMDLQPTGLKLRDQKSIWGSCSPENKISLNFKLIVAPLEVIDYVIIHELAHIKHKNHSARFWKLVERYTCHREFSRKWLREHQFKVDFLAKKSELTP